MQKLARSYGYRVAKNPLTKDLPKLWLGSPIAMQSGTWGDG